MELSVAVSTATRLLWLSLILFSCTAQVLRDDGAQSLHQAPLFHASDLQSPSSLTRLADAMASTGLVALQLNDSDNGATKEMALQGLCRCDLSQLEGSDSVLLGDGQTIRSTVATATVGFSPLPLQAQLSQQCGPKTAQALEALRDQVAEASSVFIEALDNLLMQARRGELFSSTTTPEPLLSTSYGVTYHTVSSIVQAASNLEHFHVYSKSPNTTATTKRPALQVHTDAGLFLAFLPAHSCGASSEADPSFHLQDPSDGRLKQVVFPPNSIAIMLGAGAEQWLHTPALLPLKATRHAVHMTPGQSRAWYGMMHLVPESAIVENTPEGHARTFGDMRQAMVLRSATRTSRTFGDDPNNKNSEDISIGCGFSSTLGNHREDDQVGGAAMATLPRRRLQHVENAEACNNQTNFYCWMSCLDIPDVDNAGEYARKQYGLYCLDPAVLKSTGEVSKAIEPCTEAGTVGFAMNTDCVGLWQPKAPDVPSQEVRAVIVESNPSQFGAEEEPWCYGGTSMYMDGFNWIGTTCVIYLFPSLTVTSPAGLFVACLFTIAFGMALEWVIQRRRITVKQFGPGRKRLAVSAGFYGVQLTMGYTIMLVVMIYSIPLFVSVVLGIVGGHVLFSAPDAILRSEKSKTNGHPLSNDSKHSDETEDPIVLTEDLYGSVAGTSSSSRQRKKETLPPRENSFDPEVPEGSTPCCQNQL